MCWTTPPWPRVIRVHRDQAGDLALFQNQADRWKTDPGLTDVQRTEVAAYEKLIAQHQVGKASFRSAALLACPLAFPS